MTIKSETNYWHKTWEGRIRPGETGGVVVNAEKFQVIIKALWKRLEFIGREKFEIGCGTGIHAQYMAALYPCYKTMWTGVDLAESAIAKAKSFGLNAEVANIYEYTSDKKYEVFLMLDSLEHFEDHERLAAKIKELAAEQYMIFGNVPMYESTLHHEGGFERPMDIHTLRYFLERAGFKSFKHRIFGSFGHPYMLFQGWSTPTNQKRIQIGELS